MSQCGTCSASACINFNSPFNARGRVHLGNDSVLTAKRGKSLCFLPDNNEIGWANCVQREDGDPPCHILIRPCVVHLRYEKNRRPDKRFFLTETEGGSECRNTPNYGMIFQGTHPWLRKLGLAVTYTRDGHQQQYERRRVITTKVITSSYHL